MVLSSRSNWGTVALQLHARERRYPDLVGFRDQYTLSSNKNTTASKDEERLLLPSCPSIEFAGGDVLSTSSAFGKEVMDKRDVGEAIARSVAVAMIAFCDAG